MLTPRDTRDTSLISGVKCPWWFDQMSACIYTLASARGWITFHIWLTSGVKCPSYLVEQEELFSPSRLCWHELSVLSLCFRLLYFCILSSAESNPSGMTGAAGMAQKPSQQGRWGEGRGHRASICFGWCFVGVLYGFCCGVLFLLPLKLAARQGIMKDRQEDPDPGFTTRLPWETAETQKSLGWKGP